MVCTPQQNGDYSKSVPFWREVRGRAAELYQRKNAKPGLDYALTEVLHCKSRNNEGVASAVDECAKSLLGSRPVVLGSEDNSSPLAPLQHESRQKYCIDSDSRVHGPINIGGRDRFVVFLSPAGFEPGAQICYLRVYRPTSEAQSRNEASNVEESRRRRLFDLVLKNRINRTLTSCLPRREKCPKMPSVSAHSEPTSGFFSII